MLKKLLITAVSALAVSAPAVTIAAPDTSCQTVNIGNMPWTGNIVKSKLAAWMLTELGYKAKTQSAYMSIVRQSVAQGDSDVSFGLWLPIVREGFSKYMIEGKLDIIATNVKGARYTLAVPDYVYAAGVHDHADLDQYRERFDGKIFGSEPGLKGNVNVNEMIQDDVYGLGDWNLVESSEAGMLAAVKRKMSKHKWVVFTGWTPHPMDAVMDIKFLSGGDKYWGPDGGSSTVSTYVTSGYAWRCPNVGQFLKNYWFTAAEQSTMAKYVLVDEMDDLKAGQRLIQENPDLLKRWLGHGGKLQDGPVTTFDGEHNAISIVKSAMNEGD